MLDLFYTADILALRLIEADFLGPHCLGSGTDMKTGQRDITYERGSKKLTTEEANLWLKHINPEIIVTKVFEYTDKDTGKTYVRILFDYIKHESEKDVVLEEFLNKTTSSQDVEHICDDVIEVECDLPVANVENKQFVVDFIKKEAIHYLKNHGIYETLTVHMIYDIINGLTKRLAGTYEIRISNIAQRYGHLCLLFTVFLNSGHRTEFMLTVEPISTKPKIYFESLDDTVKQ